jgi:hypothetical protein
MTDESVSAPTSMCSSLIRSAVEGRSFDLKLSCSAPIAEETVIKT